jgi:SAM-dependent methyltransferase
MVFTGIHVVRNAKFRRMSIAHHHICACVNTEVKRIERRPVRVLDIGCGDGRLMSLIQSKLSEFKPGLDIEIYGFDVSDAHVQSSDYFMETLTRLKADHPHVDWPGRLIQIRSSQPWPFADAFFDVAVSNQVLEHVHDHEFFVSQLSRVLSDGGVAIHLFPLSLCIFEWHVNLPFAHWITDYSLLRSYLRWLSRLGLGKCKTMKFMSLEEWCEQHADYLIHETNYQSVGQIKSLAKRHHMRCSFKYTAGFYTNKLRQVGRSALLYEYAQDSSTAIAFLLSRLSCVTAVMEKRNTYLGAHPVAPGSPASRSSVLAES